MALNNFNWDVSGGLRQGISSAGQGLGAGIQQMGAQLKKAKAYRAMAVDAMGMDPDQVDKMSADELEGIFMGQAMKKAREGEQRQEQFNRKLMERMYEVQDPPMSGMITEDGGEPLPGQAPVQTFAPQDLMGIAAETGMLTPQMAMKFMEEGQGTNWEDVMPREFQTPGGLKGVYGRSGQFQFDPTQFMQDGPEVVTEDGRQFMRNPRGGFSSLGREPEPKSLPDSYNTRLAKLMEDFELAQRNAGLGDEELKARKVTRSRYESDATRAQTALQNLLDSYRQQGYGTPDFWAEEYPRYGLTAPAAAKSGEKPTAKPKANEEAILAEANAAIAAGADPAKVKARLKEKFGIEVK